MHLGGGRIAADVLEAGAHRRGPRERRRRAPAARVGPHRVEQSLRDVVAVGEEQAGQGKGWSERGRRLLVDDQEVSGGTLGELRYLGAAARSGRDAMEGGAREQHPLGRGAAADAGEQAVDAAGRAQRQPVIEGARRQQLGLEQEAFLARVRGKRIRGSLEHGHGALYVAGRGEREAQLARRLHPAMETGGAVERLSEAVDGVRIAGQPRRAPELEERVRSLVPRGRLVQRPPQERERRRGRPATERAACRCSEPLDDRRVTAWLGGEEVYGAPVGLAGRLEDRRGPRVLEAATTVREVLVDGASDDRVREAKRSSERQDVRIGQRVGRQGGYGGVQLRQSRGVGELCIRVEHRHGPRQRHRLRRHRREPAEDAAGDRRRAEPTHLIGGLVVGLDSLRQHTE